MLFHKKYRLLPAVNIELMEQKESVRLHRIEALKDIPEHNVKKGDIGGYVSGPESLNQKGSCWIANDAIVISTGLQPKVISVNGSTLISEHAFVKDSTFTHFADKNDVLHCPNVSGRARILNSVVNGDITISDSPLLSQVIVAGESSYYISGNARMHNCVMQGAFSFVGGNAVLDGVTLTHNVHLTDNVHVTRSTLGTSVESDTGMILIQDDCSISGMEVRAAGESKITLEGKARIHNGGGLVYNTIRSVYKYDITIGDNAVIESTDITGSLSIEGNVQMEGTNVLGQNVVSGDVKMKDAMLRGVNHISGQTTLPEGSYIQDQVIDSNKVMIAQKSRTPIGSNVNSQDGIQRNNLEDVSARDNMMQSRDAIEETLADYDSYTTDIVKLLKYPAMVDSSLPEVNALMVAIRKAKRALKVQYDATTLQKIAEELESAFCTAESRARTLSVSHLDERTQKTLESAGRKFAIATDNASTENEKKLGFKSGMKDLEGVLLISDEAIVAFKAKAGLLEITA